MVLIFVTHADNSESTYWFALVIGHLEKKNISKRKFRTEYVRCEAYFVVLFDHHTSRYV